LQKNLYYKRTFERFQPGNILLTTKFRVPSGMKNKV
jgi:hypothetical protein